MHSRVSDVLLDSEEKKHAVYLSTFSVDVSKLSNPKFILLQHRLDTREHTTVSYKFSK